MCKKIMYSDYYERTYTKEQIESALTYYLDWCNDNGFDPEVEVIENVSTTGILDHVLYHAEIQGFTTATG